MPNVLVKEYGTNAIVDRIPCETERSAERVEDGLNINLNHDKYYTEIER